MASYVDSSLTRNEEVIARAQVSWLSELIPMIIGVVCIAFFGLGLLILLFIFLKIATTELALTNQRIIAKTGLIRRNTVELRLDKVESLGVHQGVLGRILGYGSIVISGTGGTKTPIPYIKKPLDFRRVVNNFIEEMSDKK